MLVGLYSVVFINRIVLEVGNNILHVTRAKMQKDQFIRHDLQQKVSLSTEVFHTGNCCVWQVDISPLFSVLAVSSEVYQPVLSVFLSFCLSWCNRESAVAKWLYYMISRGPFQTLRVCDSLILSPLQLDSYKSGESEKICATKDFKTHDLIVEPKTLLVII